MVVGQFESSHCTKLLTARIRLNDTLGMRDPHQKTTKRLLSAL